MMISVSVFGWGLERECRVLRFVILKYFFLRLLKSILMVVIGVIRCFLIIFCVLSRVFLRFFIFFISVNFFDFVFIIGREFTYLIQLDCIILVIVIAKISI